MNDAVIALGCSSGGLGIIRALGKRGLHVIAVTHDPDDIGLSSKYTDEAVVCPHPSDLEAFRDFFLEKAPLWGGCLVIESGDYYAAALSKLKDDLSPHYRLTTQSWDVLSLFVEKENTYKLADECGVPCPRTHYPESLSDLDDLESDIVFPCIVKPTQSHEFVAHFNTKLFLANSFEELAEQYALCLDAGLTVILQEIVPGDDSTYERVHIYLNSRGEPGVEVYHKTLRLSPANYGVMRVGATVPPIEEVRKLSYRLLEHAGYHTGVACFQFKRHQETGQLMLIEVNGRIPRSVEIDLAAGVDIPWIMYQDMIHDVQLPLEPYQETTWIEFWPDVLNTFTKDGKDLFSLRKFLAPYLASNKTFAIFSWSDPKPFFKQTSLLPRIAKRKMGVKGPKP